MASIFSNTLNNWFGFKLNPSEEGAKDKSAVPEPQVDGSLVFSADSSAYSLSLGLDADMFNNETSLVNRYRALSVIPEVRFAIENIVNDAIVIDDTNPPVLLDIDDETMSSQLKDAIMEGWGKVVNVTNFNNEGYQIFERWFIDGKIYYYIILDQTNGGIKEVRQIDPRKIRKVKQVKKELDPATGREITVGTEEFFLYTDTSDNSITRANLKLSKDSVVYAHSGLIDTFSASQNQQVNMMSIGPVEDSTNTIVKSYLHGAIKPANQLQMLEEAVLIYRIVRAPERRAFYVDVDGLPNAKADQYVRDIMNRFKNKTSYDVSTGEVTDSRRHMSMIEDFFLPRRNGKSTEIATLAGASNLGEIGDLDYFKDKLLSALNVPKARYQTDAGFQIGKTDAVSREEVTFSKFITKLRVKFNDLFFGLLRVQLVSSGVIDNDEASWDELKSHLKFQYASDNLFSKFKEIEILSAKIDAISNSGDIVGTYLSKEYMYRHVLGFTDDEIIEVKKQMAKEADEESQKGAAGDDDGFGDDDFGSSNRFGSSRTSFGDDFGGDDFGGDDFDDSGDDFGNDDFGNDESEPPQEI